MPPASNRRRRRGASGSPDIAPRPPTGCGTGIRQPTTSVSAVKGADPFERADVTPLVRGADLLRVEPLRVRFVDRFRPQDVQRVRDAQLDVMLRFGFRIVKGEILGAAHCGMWSLHHDDNRSYRGGPALFWEMYERNPESGTILQVLTDALDGGKVLYRSIAATNFASLYKNRRARPLDSRDARAMAPAACRHGTAILHPRGGRRSRRA